MTDTRARESEMATSKGWTVKVDVIADPGPPPDDVTFKLESNLKGANGDLVFDKSKDKMPKVDYYLVEFDLDDKTGLNLKFNSDPNDVLWVNAQPGSTPPPCPTWPCSSQQFYVDSINPNGKRLTVRNEDQTVETFSFSLGFVKEALGPKDPNYHVRYDPIGSNKDGGI